MTGETSRKPLVIESPRRIKIAIEADLDEIRGVISRAILVLNSRDGLAIGEEQARERASNILQALIGFQAQDGRINGLDQEVLPLRTDP